jgi:hypothetical protein
MAIPETTHWYDKAGKPAYTVIGANGKERPTTLRDARKLNLYPSVTTIMAVADKPALTNWKVDQAVLSALTLPRLDGESLDDFMIRAKRDAKEQSMKAADRGTEIHADIESGFSGVGGEAYTNVRAWLDENYPGETWIAEDSFSHPAGFGGKIDLYSRAGIVVDFKTKDNLGDDASKLIYDEHGMQLSAYAHGLNMKNPRRVSIFVDRVSLKTLGHIWEADTCDKHETMFLALLKYWHTSKGYSPIQGETNETA